LELRILAAAAIIFAVAAAVIALAGRVNKDRPLIAELWLLYRTEIVVVALVLIPVVLGGVVFYGALLLLVARGGFEIAHLARIPYRRSLTIPISLGAAATVLAAPLWGFGAVWAVAGATAAVGLLLAGWSADGNRKLRMLAALSIVLLGLILAHIALARAFLGAGWLVLIYGTVEVNDAFALLGGKLFGRHPVFPRLSPRKTWEGLIAGILCGGLAGMLIAWGLLALPPAGSATAVAIILAGGLLGDVLGSAAKRSAGQKDFAPLHPALGGVLDIYDSFLVAVPLVYYFFALTA
jgi:phosphatidate cytidylyltransferase